MVNVFHLYLAYRVYLKQIPKRLIPSKMFTPRVLRDIITGQCDISHQYVTHREYEFQMEIPKWLDFILNVHSLCFR